MGWTHRNKRKNREPYLKFYKEEDKAGATFVDMQQAFHYVSWEDVLEL